MNKYGLTEERYNQLLALYGDDGEVAEKVKDYGENLKIIHLIGL